jgi:hypothetical protein
METVPAAFIFKLAEEFNLRKLAESFTNFPSFGQD